MGALFPMPTSRLKEAVTARTPVAPDEPALAPPGGPWGTVRAYVALTKPRIIELLLVTTFPVMFLAERGLPDLWLVASTLVGGTLAASSANVFNCYLDRDIDARMMRTANRPLVTGEVSERGALLFGTALGVASTLYLGLLVNTLSAVLAVAAILLYVIFYTILLKRRTSQNIVWGGIAGCMPVLIGWAAVRDSVSWAALVLFLVVFFWTPPHYWPLSMKFRKDYERAGVPMLPVVAHNTKVARHIVAYAWVTTAVSLALVPVAPMGWVYTVIALLSGGAFIAESHRLLTRAKADLPDSQLKAMRLFHYSITYLTLVFVGVAADPFVYLPVPGIG